MEQNELSIGIYRNLSNRIEGLPDDSPRALELHQLRQRALEGAFPDEDPELVVVSWGLVKDETSHEWIEMIVAAVMGFVGSDAFRNLVTPAAKWVAMKIAEKAADTVLAVAAGAIVDRLDPKQKADEIWDYTVQTADGSVISVGRPGPGQKLSIQIGTNGKVEQVDYVAAA